MTTEALKSTPITNLDASPPVRSNVGAGAVGRLERVSGYITVTDTKTAGSTYQMVRIPSNCYVKDVRVSVDVTVTTLTCDIGLYYSTGVDGTQPSLRGTEVDADFFASAVDLKTKTSGPVSQMNESATYTAAKRQQPIWQAAGLTSDPGGFFDIVLTNTATNSGAAVVYLDADIVHPGG